MYHNMFFGGMWFSWIFWIILFALLAWLVVKVINHSNRGINNYPETDSPIDILNKRYAKGEINKEEYEEIKKRFK